jgi:hypothetical protein
VMKTTDQRPVERSFYVIMEDGRPYSVTRTIEPHSDEPRWTVHGGGLFRADYCAEGTATHERVVTAVKAKLADLASRVTAAPARNSARPSPSNAVTAADHCLAVV